MLPRLLGWLTSDEEEPREDAEKSDEEPRADAEESDGQFVPSRLDHSVRQAHGGGTRARRELAELDEEAERLQRTRDEE